MSLKVVSHIWHETFRIDLSSPSSPFPLVLHKKSWLLWSGRLPWRYINVSPAGRYGNWFPKKLNLCVCQVVKFDFTVDLLHLVDRFSTLFYKMYLYTCIFDRLPVLVTWVPVLDGPSDVTPLLFNPVLLVAASLGGIRRKVRPSPSLRTPRRGEPPAVECLPPRYPLSSCFKSFPIFRPTPHLAGEAC